MNFLGFDKPIKIILIMDEIDNFYMTKPEPLKGCLLSLRDVILRSNPEITEAWKYRMPFFYFRKRMFCYLWVHKKTSLPYIGVVEGRKISHPRLVQEKRSRMKIMFIDPTKDLPVRIILSILKNAASFYRTDNILPRNKTALKNRK
jgi:hypothetical protein